MNKIQDLMKKKKKYDYSDIQELKVCIMRMFPKKARLANDDRGNLRWTETAEKMCDEADQRIAKGEWSWEAHKALKVRLVNNLSK